MKDLYAFRQGAFQGGGSDDSATSEKHTEKTHVMVIDLSKAFDCIDRSMLMQILGEHEIATEDELRLIQRLMSETKLQVKLSRTYGENLNAMVVTAAIPNASRENNQDSQSGNETQQE